MARSRSRPSQAPDTFDEFESWGEGALQWVADHARIVLGAAAALLVLAGAWGFWSTAEREREAQAADALARTREAYMAAMGASPGAIDVPELANPAAAEGIRSEYVERFAAVGDEHRGTRSAAFAELEAGNLLAENGDTEAALETWRSALAEVPGDWPVAGLLHRRVGQALEARGEWLAAAEAYEAAAAVPEFTFAGWALADAARCYVEAEQADRAVALMERLEAEAPDLALPEYLVVQFREIRAAQAR